MDGDIRVLEARTEFTPEVFRTPFKFGAATVRAITFAHVALHVENRRGQRAWGRGGILLSDGWAFPSAAVGHPQRDQAMRRVTEQCALVLVRTGFAHPIEIFLEMQAERAAIARSVSTAMELGEPLPALAALVAASPVDAALHDGFGRCNGICTYDGYGPEHMRDLGHYLGPALSRRYLRDVLHPAYRERLACFHVVGGLDPLVAAEVPDDAPRDGVPNALEEWIERDGVFCFKVKLRGTDLVWDLERMLAVADLAYRRVEVPRFSVDANEQCEGPEYMVAFLEMVRERSPRAWADLLFVEQPTERDLGRRKLDLRPVSRLKPVLIDESLASLADFDQALELGWSGVALKTCKSQSLSLLLAARAVQADLPYGVQDLTNPGIALIQSVGLAARLDPLGGIEANARQYAPGARALEMRRHPDIAYPRSGWLHTGTIGRTGLGY